MPISNRATWREGHARDAPRAGVAVGDYEGPSAPRDPARTIDSLMGIHGYERHREALDALDYRNASGEEATWTDYARWGYQLYHKGRAENPPSGHEATVMSRSFTCSQCHNDQREDPVLTEQDPEARFDYIEAQLRLQAPGSEHLKIVQGVTMWGAVNRQLFYNGIFSG